MQNYKLQLTDDEMRLLKSSLFATINECAINLSNTDIICDYEKTIDTMCLAKNLLAELKDIHNEDDLPF